MSNTTQQPVLFPELFSKPVHISFSRQHLSSNGGSILLSAADRRLQLTEALGRQIRDRRQASKVDHAAADQIAQRVYGIAAGSPDGNDSAKLRNDPLMKLACNRDPVTGDALASQPTLSRFENSMDAKTLLRMSAALAETVIGEQARRRKGQARPHKIIIDMDPTCDPTHGAQQLSMFSGFYDTWCYLPLVVTISFDNEKRKYPVAALLRPGTAAPMAGAIGVIKRLVKLLRRYFQRTRIYLRADSAFAVPAFFDFLESRDIRYAIAMGSNAVLKRLSNPLMERAREASGQQAQSITLYGEESYRARSWSRTRWVAFKAQVLVHPDKADPRDNDRYVINALDARYSPKGIMRFYYGHSDMENSIKELKNDLCMDRTSCSRFYANQFRVILTLAAYVLMQSVQEQAEHEAVGKLRMATLRDRLLKVAVRVTSSVRRITLEFTSHHPWVEEWLICARSLGAVPI